MLSRSVTVWTQTTWPSSALGFISSPEWCLCLLRLFALPVSCLVTSWCNTWTTDSDFLRTCVEYLSTRKCYITFVFTLIHFHWMHPCLARFFDYDAGVKFQSNSKCQQLYYQGSYSTQSWPCNEGAYGLRAVSQLSLRGWVELSISFLLKSIFLSEKPAAMVHPMRYAHHLRIRSPR